VHPGRGRVVLASGCSGDAHAAEEWMKRNVDARGEMSQHPGAIQGNNFGSTIGIIVGQKTAAGGETVAGPRSVYIDLEDLNFEHVAGLGLYDSDWALVLTYPTFLVPFCTWLLMGYFRTIPYELEECAMIDGASRLQVLRLITLPLAVPGLISAGIFAFTLSWNEFIYALTFISSTENKTVPVGAITELVEGDVYHWGSLMAAALLGSLPVVILYSFFVEYYVSSLTGAVKE